MNRRDFVKAAGALAGGSVVSRRADAAKKAPLYMPIVADRVESPSYSPCYVEPEIVEPVLLCDSQGRLNPEARGYARSPLIRANLSGNWPRKKRWNFWNFICDDFVFSATIADIDYGAFCALSFTEFGGGQEAHAMALKRGGIEMAEEVERSIDWTSRNLNCRFDHRGHEILVEAWAKDMGGAPCRARLTIAKPAGHQTLNIVVPWSEERFQMNSKHNTLPVSGWVEVGGRRFEFPSTAHAVQDFGRGLWPYRSYWNWAVLTGHVDGVPVGVNMGARWTTGTGSNENGICYDGKLYKVMEDLAWDYDPGDWDRPWTVKSTCTDTIDLTLYPIRTNINKISMGLLSTGGACSFGRWRGTVRFESRELQINDVIGWAEEFSHRW